MAEHSLRHRLEYAVVRAITGALVVSPEVVSDRGGAALGWLIARLAPFRRTVVLQQLARSFPEAEARWVRDIARRCYAHLGAEFVAMVRLASLGPEGVRARTKMDGFEVIKDSIDRGQGVVVVTGHLGNWEIGGAAMAAWGVPVDVVVARQRNKLFDGHIVRSRKRLGMNVIPREVARAKVLESLRAGRVVGILGDQDARKAGVFVDFFGQPASTARGPALFALRARVPLVVGIVVRDPGPRPRYSLNFRRVEFEATGDLRTDVLALTQAYTARLEYFIREAPEQYFWLHKRWKTAPPDIGGAEKAKDQLRERAEVSPGTMEGVVTPESGKDLEKG